MIKQLFFTKIQKELSKNNPNIDNLLFSDKKDTQCQQFNEFVLKHLHKYITHHKYYKEFRDALAKNINESQISIKSQKIATQDKEFVQNNQIRLYVTHLLKQLRQQNQSIKMAQQNLHKLRYLKFESGQAFNKKVHKLVELMNAYQSFLYYFSTQSFKSKQQSKQSNQKWKVHQISNEFVQNKFVQSMSNIQLYVMDYLGGKQVLEEYKLGLSQFSIKTESCLKQNIDILCKNALKSTQQLKDGEKIINQMIICVKQKKFFVDRPIKEQQSAIEVLLMQLKKQINTLMRTSNHYNIVSKNIYSIFQWFTIPYYINEVDKLYKKLPYTISNASFTDKIKAIQQTINQQNYKMNQFNDTIATIQKYSNALNNLVHKCFFYFKIKHEQDVLQPQFSFSLKDLQNIVQVINSGLRQQGIVNEQRVQDHGDQASFEYLSEQLQVCYQKSINYQQQYNKNNQSLVQKEFQITELTQRYEQTKKQLTRVKQENKKLEKHLQQKTNQIQLKIKQQKMMRQKQLAKVDPKYEQYKEERDLEPFSRQAQKQFQQLNQQIHKLKQENQGYFNQKIALINKIDLQKQRSQRQLQSLKKEKESQMEQLKKKFDEDKQRLLKQILAQHEQQKMKLTKEKDIIQQEYKNFKNKYYEQLEQSYNRSIQRYLIHKQEEYLSASINTSMILQEEGTRDELNQIIKLQKQNQRKFIDQIQEHKKNICVITRQLQKTTKEKEIVHKQHASDLQQIKTLKEQLKKQRQERTLQETKFRNTNEDLKKVQQTLHDLQETIQNQRKDRQEKRQIQENINQQRQISSNLPTLIHYNRQLFNVDIFDDNQKEKKKLVDHLQWYARSRIKHTKLVHKFDPKNKINFHQYIDEIKGLTLIIKTKNAIIAGFYPGVYRDLQVLNKGGLIVSVTNNNSYCMNQRKKGDTKNIYRGMIYDTFFAIYGNAQIRIKTGLKTVFSNFGVSNTYFNSRGDKVDKFLNEGDKREVQFQLCQFYQVSFETQQPNYR